MDETNKVGLDRFTYLPEYDAYYYFHGDINYLGCFMDSGFRDKDGNVYLYYEALTGYENEREPVLKKNGDGYLFYSNVEITSALAETK